MSLYKGLKRFRLIESFGNHSSLQDLFPSGKGLKLVETNIAMELNSYSCIQNGKVRQYSKDTPKILKPAASKVIREKSPVEALNERTDYEITELASSLPTVFEDKTVVKRKLSNREQFSNFGKC